MQASKRETREGNALRAVELLETAALYAEVALPESNLHARILALRGELYPIFAIQPNAGGFMRATGAAPKVEGGTA